MDPGPGDFDLITILAIIHINYMEIAWGKFYIIHQIRGKMK